MAKLIFGSRAAGGAGSRAAESTRTRHAASSSALQVSEDIIPIAELKARLSEMVRGLSRRRPLVITLNGKPAAVMMSPREYDRIAYRERVLAKINEGLQDVAEGRTYSHAEVGRMIGARFAVPPKKKR
ncbi:MAG TPA: type II toxin-antitoxin system Phd/YefM family antitoxin [Kofleriaceae bacterium]|nr:type II toxin-antitoxin system Phd/YefM family antitoxin [Kofleriaceae bacterium]